MKAKAGGNWIWFGSFCAVMILYIYWQVDGQFFMINEDVALLILVISPVLRQYNLVKSQIILFFVLFIPLLGFLYYSYTVTKGETSYIYNSTHFVGISPIVFLILLIYTWVIRSSIIKFIREARYGSDKEQDEKFSKLIDFYYKKFNSSNDQELLDIMNRYDQYPLEAKMALDKIRSEKELV